MTLSLIIGLILFGILLILIEIFITPGFIVGVLGTIFLAVGILYTYKEHGNYYGNITLGATAIFLSTTIILAFRNGAWNRFAINDVIEGKANNVHTLEINIGDVGTSLSALRPAGTAMINGQKVEVHTDGEFILANVEIEVVKKVQNRIYIKKINT
ncbi:MAG: NfeD family protein [Bacteroidia bacterium]